MVRQTQQRRIFHNLMKNSLLLIIVSLVIASCAEYPIAVAVQGDHGTYSYSSKGGLVVTVQK